MENYGLALEDANVAIECDPTFIKGYYRQGSSNLALGKFEKAFSSFKKAASLNQKD